MKLEEIAIGNSLSGVEPTLIVSVVAVRSIADGAVEVIYKTPDGTIHDRLLGRADEESINIATAERPWSFDGDGEAFKLAIEAKRIDLAFLFDPMMAVHTSNVEPLPHQITGVYESLLPRQPLRFVLADDPGAGKTIMAGLYIRELIMRAFRGLLQNDQPDAITYPQVAEAAGVSLRTVYRYFPGGRDQLVREVIAWETGRFFGRLAEAVAGAGDFAGLLEEALVFAHRAIEEHEVLQKILETEPERLLPQLTVQSERILVFIRGFLVPYLERERLRPGVDPAEAADYVSRMLLSFTASPGRWDLTDRAQVAELVRTELVAGILEPAETV